MAARKRTPRTFDDAIQWLRGRARDYVKIASAWPVGDTTRDQYMMSAAACNVAAGFLGHVKGKVERKGKP